MELECGRVSLRCQGGGARAQCSACIGALGTPQVFGSRVLRVRVLAVAAWQLLAPCLSGPCRFSLALASPSRSSLSHVLRMAVSSAVPSRLCFSGPVGGLLRRCSPSSALSRHGAIAVHCAGALSFGFLLLCSVFGLRLVVRSLSSLMRFLPLRFCSPWAPGYAQFSPWPFPAIALLLGSCGPGALALFGASRGLPHVSGTVVAYRPARALLCGDWDP